MSKQTKQASNAKSAKQATQTKSKSKEKEVDDDAFISEDSLSDGNSRYLKFEQGDTTFRIISNPITGWLEWIEDEEDEDKKKPVRTTLADGKPEASDPENPPKKFVTFVVIDKEDDEVKILELTQQSVIKAIKSLSDNPAWGAPFTYDLNVNKKGEKLKTKYVVTPSPKSKLTKDQIATAQETPCNLEALYAGEDPWETEGIEDLTPYNLK